MADAAVRFFPARVPDIAAAGISDPAFRVY